MNELLETERWQRLREHVHYRDDGRCRICNRPGVDVHHLSYQWGFFNPNSVILVCRECHLVWQGRDPAHLDEGNPFTLPLRRIAEIARHLGRFTAENTKVAIFKSNLTGMDLQEA